MLRYYSLSTLSIVVFAQACTTSAPPDSVVSADNPPFRAALFDANPVGMHVAFRAACDSPTDTYREPDARTATCRFLPTPELAAYLLTQYDAKLEVPHIVIQKETLQREDKVEIRLSYFAEITAKSGKTQKIYRATPQLDRRIDRLLEGAGGQLS